MGMALRDNVLFACFSTHRWWTLLGSVQLRLRRDDCKDTVSYAARELSSLIVYITHGGVPTLKSTPWGGPHGGNHINHYFGYQIRILRGRFTPGGFLLELVFWFFEICVFCWIVYAILRLNLVRTWSKLGENLVQTWWTLGPNLVQTWSTLGLHLV